MYGVRQKCYAYSKPGVVGPWAARLVHGLQGLSLDVFGFVFCLLFVWGWGRGRGRGGVGRRVTAVGGWWLVVVLLVCVTRRTDGYARCVDAIIPTSIALCRRVCACTVSTVTVCVYSSFGSPSSVHGVSFAWREHCSRWRVFVVYDCCRALV